MFPTHPPPLDPRVAAATRGLFRFLSRERRRRIFHPVGRAFRCDVVVETETPFAPAGRHGGLVRLSRALGLPRPLPDVLGLALRIEDAHGPRRHQDLLLATAVPGRRGAFLPLPTSTFFGRTFSSLLPYRVRSGLALVVARAPAGPPLDPEPLAELEQAAATRSLEFALSVAPARGRWRRFGTLTLREALDREEAARLRLNPYNTGPAALPVWLPNRLRDPAYRGSQEGRPIPD